MNFGQLLHDYGWPTAMLIFLAVSGYLEFWYFGPSVRNARDRANQEFGNAIKQAVDRGNEWKELAMGLLQQNRESLTIGQQVAQALRSHKDEESR
jgi:hypothetical protein